MGPPPVFPGRGEEPRGSCAFSSREKSGKSFRRKSGAFFFRVAGVKKQGADRGGRPPLRGFRPVVVGGGKTKANLEPPARVCFWLWGVSSFWLFSQMPGLFGYSVVFLSLSLCAERERERDRSPPLIEGGLFFLRLSGRGGGFMLENFLRGWKNRMKCKWGEYDK